MQRQVHYLRIKLCTRSTTYHYVLVSFITYWSAGPYPGGYGGCNPPKFIISKIFSVNLWQLYYIDSTVIKFCTSMWLFSALAPDFYKGYF